VAKADPAQKREVAKAADPVAAMLAKMNTEIAKALPRHLSAEHFARVVTTAIKTTPALRECEPISICAAVMLAAQLGLEPGTFGHCYLIPYNNGKTGRKECQFQIGYRGLLDLVRRSGQVEAINCEAAYSKDEFQIVLGLNPDIVHKPCMDEDRGDLVAIYAVARLKGGCVQTAWMTAKEIQKHRVRFSKAGSRSSPWDTDFVEMGKKTVLKRLCKLLPMSVDIFRGVDQDGTVKRSIAADMVMDAEGERIMDDIANAKAADVDGQAETAAA
jgi:recombination protein RecT